MVKGVQREPLCPQVLVKEKQAWTECSGVPGAAPSPLRSPEGGTAVIPILRQKLREVEKLDLQGHTGLPSKQRPESTEPRGSGPRTGPGSQPSRGNGAAGCLPRHLGKGL